MSIVLNKLDDFSLANFHAVAWQGRAVALGEGAWRRIDQARANFLSLLDSDPEIFIYGVTTGFGDKAGTLLDAEGRERQAKRPPYSLGVGFGPALDPSLVRGMIFARLACFIEGHAATSRATVEQVVAMLDGRDTPALGSVAQLASGEVGPLNALFGHLIGDGCEVKDGGTLVNGAPCSAALLADAVLKARARLSLAHQVFALSIEACRSPLEAYDPALARVWKDPQESAALAALNRALQGADKDGRPPYQGPVSWRIVPRVLAQAHRAMAAAETAAEYALQTPGDNPLYFGPDEGHPYGRVVSNASFHDGAASPAIDGLTFAWADLAFLADRHAVKLHDPRVTGSDEGQRYLSHGHNTQSLTQSSAWFARKARERATPTLLPAEDAGYFKSDVLLPTFMAYEKESEVAGFLDAALATLAAVASQVLWRAGRQPAPPLRDLLEEVRGRFPPVQSLRHLGRDLEALKACFAAKAAAQ